MLVASYMPRVRRQSYAWTKKSTAAQQQLRRFGDCNTFTFVGVLFRETNLPIDWQRGFPTNVDRRRG